MQQSPKMDPLAIVSLVCGVVGLIMVCCCGWLTIPLALAAIGTGAAAVMRINKDPMLTGKGLAFAGIALGALGLIVFVLFLILGVSGQLLSRMQNLR